MQKDDLKVEIDKRNYKGFFFLIPTSVLLCYLDQLASGNLHQFNSSIQGWPELSQVYLMFMSLSDTLCIFISDDIQRHHRMA